MGLHPEQCYFFIANYYIFLNYTYSFNRFILAKVNTQLNTQLNTQPKFYSFSHI